MRATWSGRHACSHSSRDLFVGTEGESACMLSRNMRTWAIPIVCQGRTNPAFSKPCLFLSDTRHSRHFRCFRAFEDRNPCFQWVECKFVISAVFVKTAPFGRGQKHGLPKTRFVPPRVCKPINLALPSLSLLLTLFQPPFTLFLTPFWPLLRRGSGTMV